MDARTAVIDSGWPTRVSTSASDAGSSVGRPSVTRRTSTIGLPT